MVEADRAEIAWAFPVGGTWARLLEDHETMRAWRIVAEEADVVLLRRGELVVELRLGQGRIARVAIHEDEAAERVLREGAYDPPASFRTEVERALRGDPAAEARRRGWRVLTEAPLLIDVVRGVVEVGERFRWHTGGDALDRLRAWDEAERWRVPKATPSVVEARTPEEARLFVAVMRGQIVAERWGDGLEVLAYTPEGTRRFVFAVDRRADAPLDFGPGTSRCLDAAELVLFASRVERELPERPVQARAVHGRLLALASAGLLEAVRFVPPGEERVPTGVFHNQIGDHLRATQPDRFTLPHLLDEAARLDALAREWA